MWYFFAWYAGIAAFYFFTTVAVQLIRSLSKPPVDGHLQPKVQIGKISYCFILSAIFVLPYVYVCFDGYSGHESSMELLAWYLAIAFLWILKLQLQLNRLSKKSS